MVIYNNVWENETFIESVCNHLSSFHVQLLQILFSVIILLYCTAPAWHTLSECIYKIFYTFYFSCTCEKSLIVDAIL